MKVKGMILGMLLMGVCPTLLHAQVKNIPNPDEAMYNITGNMIVDRQSGKRYLLHAIGKNIDFYPKELREANPTGSSFDDLGVKFDSVKTSRPLGMEGKLHFWRFDSINMEWQYDREAQKGKSEIQSTMKTNIVLVLDNSESLDKDFNFVIKGAKAFIEELYEKSDGNDIFRVGIVGFSNMKQVKTFPITSLNADSYSQLIRFINTLTMSKGTALYYSVEKALKMLEEDVRRNIPDTIFRESRIYTFTDGLDQASVDDSRKLFTPDEFYINLLAQMKGITRKKIYNKAIHSTIITARGGDMTDKQYELFHKRSNESFDTVVRLTNMSELIKEFENLANSLVKSNYVLWCYIPKGVTGRVGWTFSDGKVRLPREPKKSKSNFSIHAGYQLVNYEERSYYAPGSFWDHYSEEWSGFYLGINYNFRYKIIGLAPGLYLSSCSNKMTDLRIPVLINLGGTSEKISLGVFVGPTATIGLDGEVYKYDFVTKFGLDLTVGGWLSIGKLISFEVGYDFSLLDRYGYTNGNYKVDFRRVFFGMGLNF